MAVPETIADIVLDELMVLVPEDLLLLEEIVWERRASIIEEPLEGAEARLLVVPGQRSIITISTSITNIQRKRFSIAHELGHLEMHRGKLGVSICSREDINISIAAMQPDLEQEASRFASCFLIPTRFVGDKYASGEPSFDLIREVAGQFDVSLTAAALRYMDFSPEPVAVVFLLEGRIVWFRATQEFFDTEVFVDVDEVVGSRTSAGRMFRDLAVRDEWRDVRASDWLKKGMYDENASIKEWSIKMPRYRAVLSLLWIDDEIYDDEVIWG